RKAVPIADNDELTRLLEGFCKGLKDKNAGAAIQAYKSIRGILAAPHDTTCSEDKRMRRRRAKLGDWDSCFSDLRAFHILLRQQESNTACTADQRTQIQEMIVDIIEDMRWLGLRVGATETAALTYAYGFLGRYTDAVGVWRDSVAQVYGIGGEAGGRVRHLFLQTHVYGLRAAVALRNTQVVREVYDGSIRGMSMSRSELAGRAQQRNNILAFFWCVFPGHSDRKRQSRSRDSPEHKSTGGSDSGADRAWDPARLGSQFFEQLNYDVQKWTDGSDRKLNSRVAQYSIRALFAEGHHQRALKTYMATALPQTSAFSNNAAETVMAPEILCEVVGGLCRHFMVDKALDVLRGAEGQYRGVYAWNTYFDGLANSLRYKRTCNQTANAADPLESLRQAIFLMEQLDSIKPDIVTMSIWLRAHFRLGNWTGAYECFRENYRNMSKDMVCWDILIRGLLETDSREAHVLGWQVVDELTRRPSPGADARLVETILLHAFPRFGRHTDAGPGGSKDAVVGRDLMDRVLEWVESNISFDRKTTYAIIIGTLLRTGQIDGALEMHQTMCERNFWPTKSINCMVVQALALHKSHQHGGAQLTNAVAKIMHEFIETRVPKWHIPAVHLPLIKSAVSERRYGDMWGIIGKHYPVVAGLPFPDANIYRAALEATRMHCDWMQHRLVLDKLHNHLGLIRGDGSDSSAGVDGIRQRDYKRMADVYCHYKNQHQ
ncbi:hypothetical protein GGF37_003100, partial [Kickxella alabastrina]